MTNKSDLSGLMQNDHWLLVYIKDGERGFRNIEEKEKFITRTNELIKNSEKRMGRLPDDYVKAEFTERLKEKKIRIKQLLRNSSVILLVLLTIGWLIFA